jgi:GntR family transcriptional regulator
MIGGQKFAMRPLYLQVRDLVLERITTGTWKPGAMLPAEVDLARELGISSGTVRKALDALEAEHVVSRRQGKGTFVSSNAAQGLASRYDNVRDRDGRRIAGLPRGGEVASGRASAAERERLRLDDGERVVRIKRVHLRADRPFMYEAAVLPARHFPELHERKQVLQRITDLAQEFGLVLGRGSESVSVAMAGAAEARALGVTKGKPVLRLDRVVCTIDGRPVEWRVAFCHLQDEAYIVEFD